MISRDPRWPSFWQNVAWYVVTMIVLMVLLSFFRWPLLLAALWLVGLVWGGLLAYKLSRLLLGDNTLAISQARTEAVVQQADEYRAKIRAVLPGSEAASERTTQLEQTVDRLVTTIEALASRISQFHRDDTIRRDLKAVPAAIEELEQRLAAEPDQGTRRQLARTLENRQAQLEALQALQNMVERAEIQTESSLSQLGTIYSQLLTGQSTSDVADYSRLTADVDEEVRRLEDQLEALREVKLGEE